MSKIALLDGLLKEYRKWTLKLKSASQNIEDNILQKDINSKLEEKVASIIISSVLVYIVIGIVGLFGVSVGGVWGVVVFAIGWLLSKAINKKVFGSERAVESLKEEEKLLLEKLEQLNHRHEEMRSHLPAMPVFFTNYPSLKREFGEMINRLLTYNASNLALKYRYRHAYLVKKYQNEVNTFHKIYANKKESSK
ncbi:hypothetical protein [Sulfurimonas sp.]|uniref:hypothetical protein n=1 Tax=Sulfurimonas sp. TaxID=2022749 RepID=UPI0025FA54F9|nr:hypothetical protein [Sulfurimonas sp.]MBW6489511.1 hypothetical protein [Sulfurimonas sp.]